MQYLSLTLLTILFTLTSASAFVNANQSEDNGCYGDGFDCHIYSTSYSLPTLKLNTAQVNLNNEIESENQITTEIMEMQIDETTTTPALDAIAKTIKKDPAVVKAAALKLYNQGGALTSEAVINASR